MDMNFEPKDVLLILNLVAKGFQNNAGLTKLAQRVLAGDKIQEDEVIELKVSTRTMIDSFGETTLAKNME